VGFFRSQGAPGKPGEHEGDNKKKEEGETPEFRLAFLEFFQTNLRCGSRLPPLRSPGIGARVVLDVHEFSQPAGTQQQDPVSLIPS
jgi:hypothetical protein